MALTGASPIESRLDLNAVLDRVTFRPSCVNFGWRWEVQTIWCTSCREGTCPYHGGTGCQGWLINTAFQRPDIASGVVQSGRGRQEWVPFGTTVSGLVKTCWLLAELIVRHELMEAFCFDGARVFDPHKTVEQLCAKTMSNDDGGGKR